MKQRKQKKKAPAKKQAVRKTKKMAPIAKAVKLEKPKFVKIIDNMPKERVYKFDDRLVPYYLGGDTREGNLTLREALVKLGQTPEMTKVFDAMMSGNLGYRDEARDVFMRAVYAIIKGHDQQGLTHIGEDDIKAIHDNNLRKFNEFWDKLARLADDDYLGIN